MELGYNWESDTCTIPSFVLAYLHERGLPREAKLPLLYAQHLKEGGSFSFFFANHVLLRLGELALEGLIGETKLPPLLWASLRRKGSIILTNHTVLELGDFSQEGGSLGEPYYFRS